MKLLGTFARAMRGDNGEIELTFMTKDKTAADSIKGLGAVPLDIRIGKQTKKRTMSANNYFWILAEQLAIVLSERGERPITKAEIYRGYIKEVGAFKTVPISEGDVERWTEIWESNGEGWIVEDTGASKLDGYHNLRCYYGSSVYDTKQMTRLIDLAIADCKELNIEVKTPQQIAEMIVYSDKFNDKVGN